VKLTIGVTGHRDLVENEKPALREQVRAFFDGLHQEYPGLDLQLLSPLAEGADQLVAEVALDMDIPVVVPMPMQVEEYEEDFQPRHSLETFRDLLGRSEIISLPLAVEKTAEGQVWAGSDRDRQYAQMGIFISNHCQILLALWDGKPSDHIGGTGGVVNYHLTAVMPGYSVADESPNLLADNENDLAYHIVVSRARRNGAPAQGLQPLDAYWMSAHFERSDRKRMPDDYHDMLLRLQAFNEDHAKYEERITEQRRSLLKDTPGSEVPGGADLVDRLFGTADWLAVHFQARFNQGMIATHALAVVMGLVFIVYAEFGGPDILLWLFLALFSVGVVFYVIGNRREWHRKYLDYRALAEGLRVQFYWNLAGLVETRTAVFAYDNFLQKQDVDLGWVRHVMRSASLRHDRQVSPADAWVDWVAGQWIGAGTGDEGQLAYYHRKAMLKTTNYRRTTRLGSISLWIGILIALVLALTSGRILEDQRNLLLVFMGVFPLIAGVRDAYSHKKAERELIKQYQFMARVFENARRLLEGADDIAFRRRVLKAVGNAALEEHAEWILMHRERPLEHGGL
jgi:hypothetical protein